MYIGIRAILDIITGICLLNLVECACKRFSNCISDAFLRALDDHIVKINVKMSMVVTRKQPNMSTRADDYSLSHFRLCFPFTTTLEVQRCSQHFFSSHPRLFVETYCTSLERGCEVCHSRWIHPRARPSMDDGPWRWLRSVESGIHRRLGNCHLPLSTRTVPILRFFVRSFELQPRYQDYSVKHNLCSSFHDGNII